MNGPAKNPPSEIRKGNGEEPNANASQIELGRFAQSASTWKSWAGSLFLHFTLAIIVAVIWYQVPKGSGKETVVTGGIVLVNADLKQNEKAYLDHSDVQNPEKENSETQAAQAAAQQLANPLDDLPDLPGMAANPNAVDRSAQNITGLPNLDDLAVGKPAKGGGTVGQSAVRFSGVTGTGSRFIYVVDRSASMNNNGGRLIKAAKAELIASLDSLNENQQFQIIFYNSDPLPFRTGDGPVQLHYASDVTKQRAINFISTVTPDGSTDHLPALIEALRLNADVIFLLTDADNGLSLAEQRRIERLNRAGASINAIVYGSSSQPTADNMTLKRMAAKNRGQFTYKSLTSLLQ